MIDENLNTFVCNLIWLIDLANDKRISHKIRQEIDELISFLYEHKNDFYTDKRDMFLELIQQMCENLGQMRYDNDVNILNVK